VAEDIIVARDLLLVESTGARYHVAHVSTQGAVRMIREAKDRSLPVTAEATPHHLMLTHEAVGDYDTTCKVNPPLREQRDVDALRRGLADGTIDAIATDHAPHSSLEKACEFAQAPCGIIGLELVVPVLLGLVHEGVLELERFLDALTRAPAGIVGIDAPTLRVGATAELCVIDPSHRHTIAPEGLRSKSRNSPFVGQPGTGRVELTMAAGRVAYRREGVGRLGAVRE
jgi:dihydroorotase